MRPVTVAPPGRQWGFPTGYANKGERHEDTIAREVREETGLTVKAGRLLKVRSGFQYRIEIYYEAVLVGGRVPLNTSQAAGTRGAARVVLLTGVRRPPIWPKVPG
jgi:8-oxo-dGTP pyrophosphatase MutT (NUDIX family)